MENVLSLQRLLHLFKAQKVAPSFKFAGRVCRQEKGNLLLVGQGHKMWVKGVNDCYQVGALFVGQGQRESLRLREEGELVLESPIEDQQMDRPLGELKLGPSPKVHSKWQNFVRATETILQEMGLAPVTTPSLVSCPGTEVNLYPFQTEFSVGENKQTVYLPTSPELHLKKLLCRDFTDIYELKTCFRNQELSRWHEPEFLMLEWYRAFANIDVIEKDLVGLLKELHRWGFCKNTWQEPQRFSMSQLFQEHLNFALQPRTTREELQKLARDNDLPAEGDSWDDLFNWLFVTYIEPKLPSDCPCIVHSYPPQMKVLATKNSNGWVNRFELYLGGFEVANAFDEMTGVEENRQLMTADVNERIATGKDILKLDNDFMAHLERGLPPAGGIALGMERLFMAMQGHLRISDFKYFCKADESIY